MTTSYFSQKAREEACELLPLVEMAQRGFLGTLAPRNFEAVDSFIFSQNIAEDGAIPRVARIQSKYTQGSTSIPLEKLGFDFLVVVQDVFLKRKTKIHSPRTTFVVPIGEVKKIWNGKRILLKDIPLTCMVSNPDHEDYVDPWNAIIYFLKGDL